MRKKSATTTTRILDAARALILEQGLKATAMEAIAARAGIAKGTLYAYFPDKQAVYAAFVDDLAERRSDAFAEAFVGDDPIADRVGRGLAASFGLMAELVQGSAVPNELIGNDIRLAPQLAAADTAISEVIIADMTQAGIENAETIVPVLMAACMGISASFTSPQQVREGIMLLCDRMVR